MEKELFPALKPWLKLLSYWPVNAESFPLRKKIHFVLYLIMFYIPSVLFVANARDYGSFFIGITENFAMIMVLAQTFLLGIAYERYEILIGGLEEAWAKCRILFDFLRIFKCKVRFLKPSQQTLSFGKIWH